MLLSESPYPGGWFTPILLQKDFDDLREKH
jgi:hypothetical protein